MHQSKTTLLVRVVILTATTFTVVDCGKDHNIIEAQYSGGGAASTGLPSHIPKPNQDIYGRQSVSNMMSPQVPSQPMYYQPPPATPAYGTQGYANPMGAASTYNPAFGQHVGYGGGYGAQLPLQQNMPYGVPNASVAGMLPNASHMLPNASNMVGGGYNPALAQQAPLPQVNYGGHPIAGQQVGYAGGQMVNQQMLPPGTISGVPMAPHM